MTGRSLKYSLAVPRRLHLHGDPSRRPPEPGVGGGFKRGDACSSRWRPAPAQPGTGDVRRLGRGRVV